VIGTVVMGAVGPGIMGFITIFVLAAFVGYEVVSKVPSILHTPLMSGSNAIHGIILVGTMIVLGQAHGPAQMTLGFLAVVLATLNVVGGFVVTDRMLHMFRAKPADRKAAPADAAATPAAAAATPAAAAATPPAAKEQDPGAGTTDGGAGAPGAAS
jgi:H+-translocating NAD(P) transhydrogenase subunit alpha